jgi:hypothetical protein
VVAITERLNGGEAAPKPPHQAVSFPGIDGRYCDSRGLFGDDSPEVQDGIVTNLGLEPVHPRFVPIDKGDNEPKDRFRLTTRS